jgi:hypothetical protein
MKQQRTYSSSQSWNNKMVYLDSSKTIIVDIIGIFYPFLDVEIIIIHENELLR